MRRWVLFATMTAAVALAGGGCWNPFSHDDDGNGNGGRGDRKTPDHLLEFFAMAYEDKDVQRYGEALDLNYRFQFMEKDWDEAGVPSWAPYWGKTEDVPRTQNMFEDASITAISFEFGEPRFVNWLESSDTIFVDGNPVEVDALLGRYQPDIQVTVAGDPEPITYWVNASLVDVKVIRDRFDPKLWTILRLVESEASP